MKVTPNVQVNDLFAKYKVCRAVLYILLYLLSRHPDFLFSYSRLLLFSGLHLHAFTRCFHPRSKLSLPFTNQKIRSLKNVRTLGRGVSEGRETETQVRKKQTSSDIRAVRQLSRTRGGGVTRTEEQTRSILTPPSPHNRQFHTNSSSNKSTWTG